MLSSYLSTLILYILMVSSFLFDTCPGVRVIIFTKYCILLSEDRFTFTNSIDPDEMQHYAAFHLGLHCL